MAAGLDDELLTWAGFVTGSLSIARPVPQAGWMNSAAAPSPKPFLPSDLPADRILVRSVTAHAVAAARDNGALPEVICQRFWPKDAATHALIVRSVSSPGTSITAGWAAELAGRSVASFVGSLQNSAGARLIEAGTVYTMPGVATITLPRASTTPVPQWILEGAPIAVAQAVIAGPQLGPPKKLALIESVTSELADATADDAETIIGTILRDGMAWALDASLFSATAADATRPAGLLFGLSGQTATTGGGVSAALADLRLLVDATVAAGGSGDVMFVSSPGRALTLRGYMPELAGRVYGSAAIAGGGVLIAVDVNSFCSMFGSDPEIRASKEAVLHYENALPLQISSGTTGSATVASPSRSLWQSDSVAFRAILRAAWALRVPGAVAFIGTGLSW